jgi:hypothetical protein
MRLVLSVMILGTCLILVAALGTAQQPEEKPAVPARVQSKEGQASKSAVDAIVERMMAFDKNKDGKLVRDEITDARLLRLFDRADANKDGVVTKEELVALATKMAAEDAASGGQRGGFGPPGGPGGFGPPGGPGGRGPGGFGPPPAAVGILPPFLQNMLKLTAEQKKQVETLQEEVDRKLDKILTQEQRTQLKEMRESFGRRGPGGPGGRGPGGAGRPPGGPPPDKGEGPPRPPE